MSAGRLLGQPRFSSFFWVQLAGAFNDNLFKNALVIAIGYGGATAFGLGADQLIAAATALFMLPYFLFSAQAGQLADKYEKAALIRWVKVAEIAIMAVGAVGFVLGSIELLMGVLFCMGAQSAFFGPVKYGILPDLLEDEELVGGNALVELATYLAILGGTITGGLLIRRTVGDTLVGPTLVAGSVILVALTGWFLARRIPATRVDEPDLEVAWDPIRPTIDIIRRCRANRTIWLSILGITWFWGYGALLLSIFPTWSKELLQADEAVATLFLALFSVGIGLGSLVADRLSPLRTELGLVPIGSLGMTLFTLDLWAAGQPLGDGELAGVAVFFSTVTGWRITIDLIGLAMCGGLYIVPLYTLVQQRAKPAELSRIIAGNNIVNAAFMVGSAVVLMGLQGAGVSVPTLFLILAAVNTLVALYMYTVVPEFVLRFLAWILTKVMYRVKVSGLEHIPREGACVLVCNHVTFVDWLIISGSIQRPARFVMDQSFATHPVIGPLSRQGGVIPIASRKRHPEVLERAMDTIAEALEEGWVVCIFPEGSLTRDGKMNVWRPGIERIVERTPAPVVPMALNGLWGSWFSRYDGGPRLSKRPRRFWSRVLLTVEAPLPPETVRAESLQQVVQAILDRHPERP